MPEERKKLFVIVGLAAAAVIIAVVVFLVVLKKKPAEPTMPGAGQMMGQMPPGMGAPGAGGMPGGAPMGAPGAVGAPGAAPAPGGAGGFGAPGAAAPGLGAAAPEVAAPEAAAAAPPSADKGYPVEPYRPQPSNPFVAEERVRPEKLAPPPRDPGALFAWAFPRPYSVWGPVPLEGVAQEIQPAAYFAPQPGTPVGEVPTAPGVAIRPGAIVPGIVPRVTAPAGPVGIVGPRVEAKPYGARLRRLSGVLHDSVAFAILEAFDGSRVRTFIVQPGDRVQVGNRTFWVRAITGDRMFLREEGRDFDTIIPLRGRTANEPGG